MAKGSWNRCKSRQVGWRISDDNRAVSVNYHMVSVLIILWSLYARSDDSIEHNVWPLCPVPQAEASF
jgi:hypothetical protein|eukprot:COSAG01_NODE_2756_length_7129_cov_15.029730_5_plen_67_part_00